MKLIGRRAFVQRSLAALLLGSASAPSPGEALDAAPRSKPPFRRVRPTDAAWPSDSSWNALHRAVGGRLIRVASPLADCVASPDGASCAETLRLLENPYYIGDQAGLTQTLGWVDAWTSAASVYAVAAEKTADVVAAVNFARRHRLRLVVKGGGHSYQGTSSCADSLLIWTHAMNAVTLHDAFVAAGCAESLRSRRTFFGASRSRKRGMGSGGVHEARVKYPTNDASMQWNR